MQMKTKIITHLALAIAVGLLATGCATTLQHGALDTKPVPGKGALGVAARAQNMKDRIGWGTFTVFAIPVAPVTVTGEADTALMDQIKDAVTQAGYQVKIVDNPSSAGNMPVLTCNVEKFQFKNYTWLFPLVFNWGTIQLDVAVTAPGGNVLWSKTYSAKGNGMYDFNTPVNNALTAVLNQMSEDLSKADIKSTTN